jgi:hypothetical protein
VFFGPNGRGAGSPEQAVSNALRLLWFLPERTHRLGKDEAIRPVEDAERSAHDAIPVVGLDLYDFLKHRIEARNKGR